MNNVIAISSLFSASIYYTKFVVNKFNCQGQIEGQRENKEIHRKCRSAEMIRKSCLMISPFKEDMIFFLLSRRLLVKSVQYVFWRWGIQFRPLVDIGFAKNAWHIHWGSFHLRCFYVPFLKRIGIMYFNVDQTEICRLAPLNNAIKSSVHELL